MTTVIEKLRNFDGYEGQVGDDTQGEIIEILKWNEPGRYRTEVVQSEYESAGRWSNYETKVYKIVEGEVTAYFRTIREVPATESQDGMELTFQFDEVRPREVTTTIYE